MFRSAVLRLTLWYLLLMMLLSLFFSLALYQVSTIELTRGLRRQTTFFRDLSAGSAIHFENVDDLRTQQIQETEEHLRLNLLYFNLIVLALSGLASYFLAKETLHPIEEALEAQRRFSADASHELRTPLTAMKTEIEVALRDKNLTLTEAKQLHQSILEEIGRLDRLSTHLLQVAEDPAQLNLTGIEEYSVKNLVTQAKKRINHLAEKKTMTIVSQIKSGSIKGHEQRLVEVLTILLDNAIKYSPPASTIVVTSSTTSEETTITVTDQGIGMSAEDLPHIFDRFYRADRSRSKEVVEGYGLGLAIAQKIMDAHRGSIEVQSQPGQGSQFILHFPHLDQANQTSRRSALNNAWTRLSQFFLR